MKKAKYLAFDTETGGLDATKNPILTAYFAAVGEDYAITDELYLRIRPEAPFDVVEPGALSVNKIDMNKHLEDPRTVSRAEARAQLLEFLARHCPKGTRVTSKPKPMGYNIDFDLDMIRTQLLSREEFDSHTHYGKVDPKMIVDFLKDVGMLPPEIGKLESLVKHFNIPMIGAHEARNDTIMMIEGYKNLVDMVRNAKNGPISFDILSVLEK